MMKEITEQELLCFWENGLNQPLISKTLLLLNLVHPDAELNYFVNLSIGRRDVKIFEIRKLLFGSRLLNIADCPECSERIEWETDINDFIGYDKEDEKSDEFELKISNYKIRFRLPNTSDLIDIIYHARSLDSMSLLKKCILSIKNNKKIIAVDNLPDSVINAVTEQMEKVDPLAEIQMTLNCPVCSSKWKVQFDIMSYIWMEIDSWAKQTFQDVYVLAKVFGWSEDQILSMSPTRRQLYLNMINI